ncbi:hypothetical protein H5T57_03495 [Candidatus Bipolaricaulota bacterium]|nr:hypothetical protein [Candidatus Bipolaricaulota bacterium]
MPVSFATWRDDRVGFRAETVFFVEKSHTAVFYVWADDGFRLYLDGKLLLDEWRLAPKSSLNSGEKTVELRAGLHRMVLEYFDWTGNAEITFRPTAKVLGLDEAVLKLWNQNIALEEKFKLVDAYVAEVRKLIAALENKVENLKSQWQNRYDEIREKISTLQEEFSELKREQDLFAQDLKDVQENITEIEEKMQLLTNAFGLFDQLQRAQEEAIERLQEKISSLQSQVSQLTVGYSQNIEAFVMLIPTLRQSVGGIAEKVEKLEVETTIMREGLKALEEKYEAEFEVLSRQVNALNESLSELKTSVLSIAKEVKELRAPTSSWEVHWYKMSAPGVFGEELGIDSFPLNFFFDWSYGCLFKQEFDHVGFKAYAIIYLPVDSYYFFRVAGNNCFALYIDGKKVLDHWGMGEALRCGEQSIQHFLTAGFHTLELHYYEWENEAWLSFYFR